MSNSEPNKLDSLLRDWAADANPDTDQLSLLQESILNEWDAENRKVTPAPERSESVRSPRSVLALGVAFGALATALVVLLLSGVVTDHDPEFADNSSDQPPPKFAWLSDAQLADKKILRDEMLEMFDRKFGWIAETGDNLEIGLDGRQNTDGTPTVAVRVIVEQRTVHQDEWKTVWAIDVVTLSEERIDITPKSFDVTGFRLWAYALPDGMVSVDTELDKQGSPFMVAEKLQRGGKPEVIFQQRSGLEEIRVLQAAAVL